MLAISRFQYDDLSDSGAGLGEGPAVAGGIGHRADPGAELAACLTRLGAQPGFVAGTVGRALDDPRLWVLETHWENVGAYRRALSSYDVKLAVVPVLSQAIDEPSAYEVIVGERATTPNTATSRQTD
ncbi:MAG: antibiotic biosynthesis monooxygenase [Nocardioidaceae bacterium]